MVTFFKIEQSQYVYLKFLQNFFPFPFKSSTSYLSVRWYWLIERTNKCAKCVKEKIGNMYLTLDELYSTRFNTIFISGIIIIISTTTISSDNHRYHQGVRNKRMACHIFISLHFPNVCHAQKKTSWALKLYTYAYYRWASTSL